jgi:drug/metabolite transporter (DMT)-like permease
MRNPPTLVPIVTVGILSISTAAIFIKLADDAPASLIAAARMTLATLMLIPVAMMAHRRKPLILPRGHWGALCIAGLFHGAHFYFWVASLKYTSVLSSVVIVTTNPIFVGLASIVLFREKLNRFLAAAIICAASGGALIAASDSKKSLPPARSDGVQAPAGAVENSGEKSALYGNTLSLLGAVMGSCYLLAGRRIRKEVDLLAYVLPVYSVAAGLLIVITLAQGIPISGYKTSTYVYFLLLAAVPQLIGHTALNWALRHMSATMVALCILGEPVGASLFAYFFLKESVTPLQACGSGLILLGIFLASRSGQAEQDAAGEPAM